MFLSTRAAAWVALTITALIVGPGSALAALSAFQFSSGTTTFTSISSTGTRILTSGDDVASTSTSIGFTFNLDGTNYTNFSASSNGLVGLTTGSVTTTWTNSLPTNYGYPTIMALWDDLYLDATQHGVWYQITGTSPTRVLTIEWNTRHISSTTSSYNFQVKLFEGSNHVQFVYGSGSPYGSMTGSIGISISSSNFLSVTPGSPATVSSTSANNNISGTQMPSSGTLYSFTLCQANIDLAGNTAQGGTLKMTDGDSLLVGKSVMMGSSSTFQPFTASVGGNPCAALSYSFAITGAGASQYSIAPTNGNLPTNSSVTPTITFTPNGDGVRLATLTISDNRGLSRSYELRAVGTRRIAWDGNISQGGNTTMADGDTLMASVGVNRNNSGTFTPLTLRNFSTDLSASPAIATYTIIDPSGQYSIAPPTASIATGQRHTPVITFSPTGLGPQYAQLQVTVDNETRTFILAAVSKAPQIRIIVDGAEVASDGILMHRIFACAGNEAVAVPLQINNFGLGDAIITGLSAFVVDTTSPLELPWKPLLRDANGQLVVAPGFQFSSVPGSAPLDPANDQTWPFIVPAGQTRTIYLNFVGQLPGRPIARVFLWSDAQNLLNPDTSGASVIGVMNFLVGPHVIGSAISGTVDGKPLQPLVFDDTKIGDSTTGFVVVANSGLCDLRVSRDDLRLTSGDVREFKILRAFSRSPIDGSTDDFVIAPQSRDTIFFQFSPTGRGGRRATLRMKTNDSTLYLEGIAERGVKYLDIFGEGTTDLVGADVYLGQVLVGDVVDGAIDVENPNLIAITVDSIAIEGPNASEFTADPNRPWPSLPYKFESNAKVQLSLRFSPTGAAGRRDAVLVLRRGSQILGLVRIRAEAGVRELTVSPLSLFDNVVIAPGQVVRQTLVISNTGTFDVVLQPPTLGGTDAANYHLGVLPRRRLAPGSTEYLEVTFSPIASGTSSATLEIASTASNSPVIVTLGGEATGIRPIDGDPTGRTGNRIGEEDVLSPAAITGEAVGSGLSVSVAPVPTSGRLSVAIDVNRAARLKAMLVDARGEVVRVIDDIDCGAGATTVSVDVADLPMGIYALRLEGSGTAQTVRFVVAR